MRGEVSTDDPPATCHDYIPTPLTSPCSLVLLSLHFDCITIITTIIITIIIITIVIIIITIIIITIIIIIITIITIIIIVIITATRGGLHLHRERPLLRAARRGPHLRQVNGRTNN